MDAYFILLAVGIYSIIYYVLFCFFLWFILKKENINCFFSIIPFANFYFYFKICNIPFWTFFVPVVNIIVLLFSTYRISYQYGFKRKMCWFSIIIPLIFLAIIAFSKRKNRDAEIRKVYIKNTKDVDKLESHLLGTENVETNIENLIVGTPNAQDNNSTSFIDKIDSNVLEDEYVYDEIIENNNVEILASDKPTNDFVELNEDDYILSMDSIDNIERDVNNNFDIKKDIKKDIIEYDGNHKNDNDIAFGGKQENDIVSLAKKDELKCSRCGSSLVGANGICPGCGAKV